MLIDDQRAVIEFLSSPATHGGAAVERVDTHASVVFLAGDRAWKLKRAVRYDYLDFSTPARRKAMCEAELRINRRTAADIYLGVAPVTRSEDGRLSIGGEGTVLDWLVEMRRFDQDQLLDRLAAKGTLTVALARQLAVSIARFHAIAEPRHDHGGRAGMSWVVEGNAKGFAGEGAGILDPEVAEDLTAASKDAIDRLGALLDERRARGFVRECHGDLHLRNIVRIDGAPVVFDGIEFNDEIACIDVLYDLAFLLMDLWKRRLPDLAHVVLNEYVAETGTLDGIALLPLFLSCRAAVRAKTSASASRLQKVPAAVHEYQSLSRTYLQMAVDLLRPPAPGLVAIGGFSGSGKSTLAFAVGPKIGAVPGAVVLRSDEIRKRMLGVSPLTPLGEEGYAEDVSRRVYHAIAERAAELLQAGHAVIADAVFARERDRQSIEEVARAHGAPFAGLWLDVDEHRLVARTAARGPDASDATATVIRTQVSAGAGMMGWARVDASASPADVCGRAEERLRVALGGKCFRATLSSAPSGEPPRAGEGELIR